MKNFISILLLLIFAACTGHKKTRVLYSDLRTENIKGDVQVMIMTSYSCDSAGQIGAMKDCCRTRFEYNEDGNLQRQYSWDSSGKLTEEETTTIHPNGLRTAVRGFRDGKQTRYMELLVDNEGRYYAGRVFDSASRLQMYYEDLVMNEFGQPVSFTLYGKDSVVMMREQARYDGNRLLSYFQADKDGRQTARFENKFNDKGEIIESIVIRVTSQGEEKQVTKHTYSGYDAKGNWTQTTYWDEKGKATGILKREFVYSN